MDNQTETHKGQVGRRIRELREDLGVSRDEFVYRLRRLGLTIHVQTLYNYETGKTPPGADDLTLIAKVLDVEPSAFYGGSDSENSTSNS